MKEKMNKRKFWQKCNAEKERKSYKDRQENERTNTWTEKMRKREMERQQY